MPIYVDDLQEVSRLLMEVPLQPLQGSRFQPTGFPDLGAAVYQTNEGQQLLVESAQSMANRLESVCWDDANQRVVEPLDGISYVRAEEDGELLTSSILEAHRLNSPYILGDKEFRDRLEAELDTGGGKPVDPRQMAEVLLRYDCNCLLHGVFLVSLDGRMRMPRSLSSFIEATGVRVATSGGVKKDHIDPTGGHGGSEKGFGHVPYSREEYTADDIRAYFNLDLSQIRAAGLPESAEQMLTTMALYKISRFLRDGLRLRTACDLETAGEIVVKQPEGWELPELSQLQEDLPELVDQVAQAGLFANPPVTTVTFTGD